MMRELGEVTPDEMVLCFLRAEIDSQEYGESYAQAIAAVGFDRLTLIDKADLTDMRANQARATVLGFIRGYGCNCILFQDFPKDVKWRRVSLDQSEFHRLRHIGNQEFWSNLTKGTRLVRDSAQNYKNSRIEPHVAAILQKIERGQTLAEIILVEDSQNRLVILEGNRRATAFAISRPKQIEALVGTSPTMDRWPFI